MWKNVLAAMVSLGAIGFSLGVSRGETDDTAEVVEVRDVVTEGVAAKKPEAAPKAGNSDSQTVIFTKKIAGQGVNSDAGVAGEVIIQTEIPADADIVGDGVPAPGKAPVVRKVYRSNTIKKDGTETGGVEVYGVSGFEVILDPETGKVISKGAPGDDPKTTHVRMRKIAGGKVSDPAAREAVEKLVKDLEDKAAQLEKEGKKDEAGHKRTSAAALRMALDHGTAPVTATIGLPASTKYSTAREYIVQFDRALNATTELSKRTAQLDEFQAALKKHAAAGNKEEAAKMQEQIAKLHAEIAQVHAETAKRYPVAPALALPAPAAAKGGFIARFDNAASPEEMKKLADRLGELQGMIKKLSASDTDTREEVAKVLAEMAKIQEAMAKQPARVPGKVPHPHPPVAQFNAKIEAVPLAPKVAFLFGDNPEAAALSQKAEALRQAAGKLKEAGLADQAKELGEQAEKVQNQADEIRKHAPRMTKGGFQAMGGFPGGPPAELLRSIHELQEQVQALRKEVGQIRELLEKKK